MKNSQTQKGYVIPLVIAILAVLIIDLVVYTYSQKNQTTTIVNTPPPTSQTGSTSPAGSEWSTYTNTKYGFTFQYPTAWQLTESADKSSVTLDAGASTDMEGGKPVETFTVTFTAVDTNAFGEHETKVGDVKYDSTRGVLVDAGENPARCLPVQNIDASSSLPTIMYGGSMMSTPAYFDYVILTNQNYLLTIHETSDYSPSLNPALAAGRNEIYSSFAFTNGVQDRAPNCSSSVSPTLNSLTPTSGKIGDSVIIHGSGFLSTNTILFGGGPVQKSTVNAAANTISFTVPSSVGADCKPNMACPMYERLITPGVYSVSVRNTNGTSSSLPFLVTGNSM